jgi:pimeloyl-ACP methyl ester carboxylesterase
VILYVAATLAVILLAGLAYQAFESRRDCERFPPPGTLVQLQDRRVHVRDMGEGSPTVIFESGLMSTVLTWQQIQPQLAKSTRAVSYDRPGLGWSDSGPGPRTAARIVEELHALLAEAKIAPPYVLVGHSFGGLTMPLFATRYPGEVCGVILIDPVAPAEWHPPSDRDRRRIEIGSKICRRAAILSHLGLLRFIALLVQSGARSFANPIIRAISKGAPSDSNSTGSPWCWNLPASERAMTPVFWTHAKFCRVIASQLAGLPESAAQVIAAGPIDKPLTVISANNISAQRLEHHKAISALSPRGRHILAERSGHWVTEDQPELVVESILKMVELARDKSEVGSPRAHTAGGNERRAFFRMPPI